MTSAQFGPVKIAEEVSDDQLHEPEPEPEPEDEPELSHGDVADSDADARHGDVVGSDDLDGLRAQLEQAQAQLAAQKKEQATLLAAKNAQIAAQAKELAALRGPSEGVPPV